MKSKIANGEINPRPYSRHIKQLKPKLSRHNMLYPRSSTSQIQFHKHNNSI
jgi:hypothetical protein